MVPVVIGMYAKVVQVTPFPDGEFAVGLFFNESGPFSRVGLMNPRYCVHSF